MGIVEISPELSPRRCVYHGRERLPYLLGIPQPLDKYLVAPSPAPMLYDVLYLVFIPAVKNMAPTGLYNRPGQHKPTPQRERRINDATDAWWAVQVWLKAAGFQATGTMDD